MSKFNSEWDEHVHEITMQYGGGSGDVAAPTGWFVSLHLDPEADEQAVIEHYGTPWLLVHESNEGFVTVRTFDDQPSIDIVFDGLERQYNLWFADIEDADARQAIDGYLQAAKFAAGFDDQALNFNGDTQTRVYNDVVDFLTQNVDEIREWMDATKHSWLQVGTDFEFSRNGRSANFATRDGAGAVGEYLFRMAHAWGPEPLALDVNGELSFRPKVGAAS